MLQVTFASGDGSFSAIFDHEDKQKAAEAVLAELIKSQGFFADNKIVSEFPSYFTPRHGVYGILLMPCEDLDCKLEGDNTWWIYIDEYVVGELLNV